MIEIKDLLLRFNNILLSEEIKKQTICDVLKEVIYVDIKKEDIKIKNNVVYLDIKHIYKNEIFIKKEIIFNKIKNVLGKKTPNNIR